MKFRRIVSACVGAILFLGVVGCGGATSIQGNVKWDGEPIGEGSISFLPDDGAGPTAGATIKDGKYEVPAKDQVPSGRKKVQIRAARKTGKQKPAGPPAPAGTMVDEMVFYPPPGAKDEPFSADVVAGKVNQFDFEVKTPSGKK